MIFLSYFIYHLFFINIFMWFTWSHSLLFKRKLCLWSINLSHIHSSRNRIIGGKKQRIVEIGKKKRILKEMERSKNMSTDLPPHLFELYCFKPVRKKKPNQPLKQLMRLAKSGFPVSEMCQRLSLSLLHNTFLSLFFFLQECRGISTEQTGTNGAEPPWEAVRSMRWGAGGDIRAGQMAWKELNSS